MDFNCFPAFPTPIAEYRFEHHLAFKERITELMARERFHGGSPAPGTVKNRGFQAGELGETPAGNTQVHDIDEDVFRTFNHFLVSCARHFSHHLLGYQDREMFVTESWINKAERGAKQFEHYHVNCWNCGTYYLNYKQGHSPTVFLNPTDANNQKPGPSLSLPTDLSVKSQFSHRNVVCNASEGSLILWPSHLKHFVPENPIEEARITISMNFMPKAMLDGSYGFAATYLRTSR
ncbi:MAG: putative 2OG-Fe(II) oxygenase [Gammaproteobacteria bacterium]